MKKYFALLFALNFFAVIGTSVAQGKMEFVANKGQWTAPFDFKCVSGTGDIYFHQNAVTYLIGEQGVWDKIDAYKHAQTSNPPVLNYHAYKMTFLNCLTPTIVQSKLQQHYYNYFLGNDSNNWRSNIHPSLALDYQEIYTGIDVHFYAEDRNLKYDFLIAANADVTQIKLKFEGADKLSIGRDGELKIQTSIGVVKELAPYAYQYINDQKVEVPCKYILEGNVLQYSLPQGYNHQYPLVIDPTVVFSTFTGSAADNFGFTATYDDLGNMYTGGFVRGVGFPVSLGAFQSTFAGGSAATGGGLETDIGIMKINSTGTTKIYATYIGGSDNDQPHSMIVDKSYNLIIAGRSYSSNYPTTASGYDRFYNGNADIVVTKLNASGTALVGSTFVGGTGDDAVNISPDYSVYGATAGLKHNYGDDARSEVNIDASGNVYVAAATFSTDFPTINPIQASNGGGQDGVIVKLNPNLTNLIFSSYIGGTNNDAAYVVTLNNAGTSIFVAGGTESNNLPTTVGSYRPSYNGGRADGFAIKIANGPYSIQNATYIGTSDYDQVYGIEVDEDDDVYMMGQTLGGTFPVTPGVYSNPGSSQFVMKIDDALASPIYSTVYGSGNSTETNISPVAFLVDTCKNVYISGWGGPLNSAGVAGIGTTTGMPITASTAIQSTTDGFDFYFIVLNDNATSLLYGSYFGRSSSVSGFGEHVDGGTSRFDKNGIVYQAMCAGCGGTSGPAFPTTAGSLSPLNGSSNCNLAALKITFDIGPVTSKAEVTPVNKGCAPFTVTFTNSSINGTFFTWDFADGTPFSNLKTPTHTFYKPGTYKVRLIAYNPNTCLKDKQYDTSFVDIIVDSNSIFADFDIQILDSCIAPYEVRLTNKSIYGTSGTATFVWDFGDGSTKYNGSNPPIHSYSKLGTYTITLIMDDPLACNNPDTMTKTVTIDSKFLKAVTNLPDVFCVRAGGLYFSNASTNAQSVFWDFGDGSTSTENTPTHIFDTGTYYITMVAYNYGACNTSDTFRKKIVVRPVAVADFDYDPKIPIENDSTHFKNLSKDAINYLWIFGDGAQSRVKDPSHLYKKTGTFKTCLVAEGYENCNDTICKDISALVVPRIDVPTAFTPNKDGINDILYVRGAAVADIEFYIYNRWGQLVFSTTTMEIGWDGTFNGKPQPMESYAYVLKAVFINGETESKRGNITILE